MTRDHLTTLWKWFSLGCFAYVVGSVITIQGGVDIFGAKLLASAEKDGLPVIGYFAVAVGSFLMNLELLVAIVFAWRHGRAWHERIPVLMLDGLKTGSIEGRAFQFTVVFVLVLVPIYGIGRSMVLANEGVICEQTLPGAAAKHYPGGQWRLIKLPPAENQLRLMASDTAPGVCSGGGVEISWYTPLVFGLLPLVLVIQFATWIFLLLRRPAQGQISAHGWNETTPLK